MDHLGHTVTQHRRGGPGRGGRARRRSLRQPAAGVVTAALLAFSAGCGKTDALEARADAASPVTGEPIPGVTYQIERLPPESLRLTGAVGSLPELLDTVEAGLAARDTARLLRLMVTQEEYRRIIYPAFPASHPPINADFPSMWVTHFPDAYRGLKRLLRRYGGKDIEILALRFEKPDQDFTNFTLHETSRVDIETGGAREDNLRLFGSVLRVGDQWKVLSYPDESD